MQDPEKILRSFESPLTFTEIQCFRQLFLLFGNIKRREFVNDAFIELRK